MPRLAEDWGPHAEGTWAGLEGPASSGCPKWHRPEARHGTSAEQAALGPRRDTPDRGPAIPDSLPPHHHGGLTLPNPWPVPASRPLPGPGTEPCLRKEVHREPQDLGWMEAGCPLGPRHQPLLRGFQKDCPVAEKGEPGTWNSSLDIAPAHHTPPPACRPGTPVHPSEPSPASPLLLRATPTSNVNSILSLNVCAPYQKPKLLC